METASAMPGNAGERPGSLIRGRSCWAAPDGKAYLRAPVSFPAAELELFFDIEVDPMRDVCYLHGFVERRRGDNGTEQFVSFFGDAPTPEAEEHAFAGA